MSPHTSVAKHLLWALYSYLPGGKKYLALGVLDFSKALSCLWLTSTYRRGRKGSLAEQSLLTLPWWLSWGRKASLVPDANWLHTACWGSVTASQSSWEVTSPVSLQRSAMLLPPCASSSSLGNEMAKRYKKFVWTLEASLYFGVPLLSLFYALLVFMEIFSLWRNWKVRSVLPVKCVFPVLSHFQAKG